MSIGRTQYLLGLMFCGIFLLPCVVGISVLTIPSTPSQTSNPIVVALVAGNSAPTVETALGLDENAISLNQVSQIDDALTMSDVDTIVVVDTPIASTNITALNSFIVSGGGLFISLGPRMTSNGTGFQELGITTSNTLTPSQDKEGIVTRIMVPDHQLTNFDWASAPPTQKMTVLPQLSSSTIVLLAKDTGFGTGGDPMLTQTPVGAGSIIVYTPWLTLNSTGEVIQYNKELTLWPYYNYFLYSMSVYLGDQTPNTYAEWAYAPVPHFEQQIIIGFIVVFACLLTVVSYRNMKKKSLEHTEVLSEIEKAELLVEAEEEVSDWEEIGMHRQIGGFLIQLFITLLIVIPRVVLSIMIYPTLIMPFPQAAGWYSFSVNFFLGLWVLFDLGTSVALAKYFAEYRVNQPEEAIKYAQIFVWFQCFTGVVQITLIAFLGSIFFPHTYLAHLSYVFIAHSLFQFPGFTLLFIHVFRGMNRVDFQQIVNILYYAVFNILSPYIFILIFRWWGAQNPIFGEALAGAIGQAMGMYITEWLTFGVSIYLFKKLGFSPSTLFRVDFRREQLKKALKFGAKWTIGAATVPLVWFYQMLLVSQNLLNWSALQGQYQLAWDLAIMVSVVGLFMESMLGGISEAYSHAKKRLTELYTAQGLKWGSFFVFWLISSLAAVGSRAILGAAGPSWAYAAHLLWFFLLFQTFGYFSWLGDWMFAGSEKTGLAASVWVLEQVIRAIAMTWFVLTEPVIFGVYLGGMPGIITGYVIGLIVKDIAVWTLVRRHIAAPKLYIWASYVGPGLAAIVNYFALEFLSQLIWGGDMITSALLFFIATLPSLYLYAFVSGLTGTWDYETLKEFRRASEMVQIKGLGWLSRRFYGSVALGAWISPLHNKFPIDIYEEAMIEAEELTHEKKELII